MLFRPDIRLNHVERAIDVTTKMLEARASLQLLLKDEYYKSVSGWVAYLKEKMQLQKKSVMETVCDLADREFDTFRILLLMAAAIEVVEEQARPENPGL
jgi:hypothetical protein